MSRFVRPSKYRHVYGQPAKKEHNLENVKVTMSAWDTNVISASALYLSINWNASGGGAFAILPLPSPFTSVTLPSTGELFAYKLPDALPLARSHTAPVLDTDWNPHDDHIVASAGEDGKVCIWSVDPSVFCGWPDEHYVPRDFDPVLRIDASPRKVGQVAWNPTAKGVLASASGEHVVKIWDVANPENARIVLDAHGDTIQSVAWNQSGTLVATTSRDRKLRMFDPRAGTAPVQAADGHGGIKGARVVWMGETGRLATTGFSKMSDRQVGIWDATAGLQNTKMVLIDQSAGIMMPFWSDNGLLFLAGKGDGNIRYYEYESDSLFSLAEYTSTQPQRGMTFLPRRALSVSDCEIARAYKVGSNYIEPIAFIVPRKADSFQADIYPPAQSLEPSLTASQYFSSSPAHTVRPKLINLDSGRVFESDGISIVPPTPPSAAPYTPAPVTPATPAPVTPTKTFTAPAPAPAAAPAPVSTLARQDSVGSGHKIEGQNVTALKEANAHLTNALARTEAHLRESDARFQEAEAQLREARAQIRNLELQVESMKVNARKAAEALLQGGA